MSLLADKYLEDDVMKQGKNTHKKHPFCIELTRFQLHLVSVRKLRTQDVTPDLSPNGEVTCRESAKP
jgi:hypothetical protein